jgi:hypothetical protein
MCAGSTFLVRRRAAISIQHAAISIFLWKFDREHPEALSIDTHFGFKEALEALFRRPVDLVEPGAVRNPYLKASIDASRELVFEA